MHGPRWDGAVGVIWAYVDESGDRGMHPRSSPYFTMAAVLVREENMSLVRDFIPNLRPKIGRGPGGKLKWTDLAHLQRVVTANELASLPVRLVYVTFPKANLGGHLAQDHAAFYNYSARFVLERLSWFGRKHHCEVRTIFEKVRGFDPNELLSYVHHLRSSDTSIEWAHIGSVEVHSPAAREGLCSAGMAAGIFDSATRRDPATNLVEPTYLRAVASRVWTSRTGHIKSYGIKVLGETAPLEALPWRPLEPW